MFPSRLLLLPAFASGALALGVYGCASQPQSPGFNNSGDDAGSSSGDYADSGNGGNSSGGGTSSGNSSSSNGGTSSSATSSTSSSGGAPSSSSSSSSGTTSSSSSSGGTTAAPCAAPGTLIDDMTGTGGAIITCGGRMGFWYTYDDGTAGATLTPPAMASFPYTAIAQPGPAGTGPDGGPGTMAAMMMGMGFTSYGAGMGFDLSNAGGTATKGTYNASAYSGVTFWAMGAAGGVVRFNVPDKDTDPSGGVCSGTSTSQCNDHHGHTLTLTTTWQQFTFTWAELTQQGYGYAEANIDTAALVGMQFQVNSPTGTFDVWVTDVAFTQ
ncbi:MAG: hypothetical protein ACLP1X_13830 [Polyangiaceae bacterium]|jgi:hypothetical protein